MVDALQLVVNTVIAIATVIALFTAIRNSKSTADFSRETLEEAQENRKDDVIPILSMSHRSSSIAHDKDYFFLKNTGQGPMFDFKVLSPDKGILIAQPEVSSSESNITYYVVIDDSVLEQGQDNGKLVYGYKDMYGREFKVEHKVHRKDGVLRVYGELRIPVKLKKPSSG